MDNSTYHFITNITIVKYQLNMNSAGYAAGLLSDTLFVGELSLYQHSCKVKR